MSEIKQNFFVAVMKSGNVCYDTEHFKGSIMVELNKDAKPEEILEAAFVKLWDDRCCAFENEIQAIKSMCETEK